MPLPPDHPYYAMLADMVIETSSVRSGSSVDSNGLGMSVETVSFPRQGLG